MNGAVLALPLAFSKGGVIMAEDHWSETDTRWTELRWAVTTWFLRMALKLAPDGTAACALEDVLNEWAMECRAAWCARYKQED